jgi:hypothetical protein
VTRTVRTSLGTTPLTGKQGTDQAARFKQQLRSLHKQPENVWLLTATHAEPPHMEVVAWHDADDPIGAEWVRQAQELAPELWRKLAERRKGVVRA